jgi:hypothetical protein
MSPLKDGGVALVAGSPLIECRSVHYAAFSVDKKEMT